MRSLGVAFGLGVAAIFLLTGGEAAASRFKDKSKPVRAALENRYAEMKRAYLAHDSSTVLALRLPSFFSISPKGDTANFESARAYTRASLEQVRETLVLDWILGVIEVQGDTAAAELDQHWVRRQLKGGAVRTVDTGAHQRETWIRSGGQWLLWRVDHVEPGEWRVDDKRIDPSKPYDPSAPEYRP